MKPKVIFVNTGKIEKGELKTSTFVKSQANSLSETFTIKWFLLGNNTSPSSIIKAIKELKVELKNEPDIKIVHAHYGSMTSYIAARAMGHTPLVVSYGGDDLLGTVQPGIKWRIREAMAKQFSYYAARKAHSIIVKSKNLMDALPKASKLKASIIPNGVNTEIFKSGNKLTAREVLGLDSTKKYVLFNASKGNNIPVKNRPLAEAAVKVLQQKYPKAELLVASGIPQQEFVLMMQAADALILTSLHEGSPNVVKEAMSSNLPVVSVNCGDVEERLVGINLGGVVDYSAEALANALGAVFESKVVYNGRTEIFNQKLDHLATAKKIAEVYQQVLAVKAIV